ncbi:MAG: hypothetical protein Q9202_004033 [Teloschistes flavicans]
MKASQPVYGLVFLFKWRAEDPDRQEQTCPEGIWFANQTAKDACASVALLNIVNNIPEIELGENLQRFKDFSADFTPSLRGDAISNFDFVKAVHNSFARKMDILNADLQLKNDALPRRKAKAKGTNDDDAGFHFIAFVPIQGKVWKLDGLERQPQNLGEVTTPREVEAELTRSGPIVGRDWVVQVAPEIDSRMAQYGDGQIEFAVLALVKEPLGTLVTSLSKNVNSIRSVMRRLDCVKADLQDSLLETLDLSTNKEIVLGPSEQYYLDQIAIDRSKPCDTIVTQLESGKVPDLKLRTCDMEYSCPGQSDCMTLKETLPLFLALSALQNSVQESTITELWMRLAAGYMAQAYAEQVLTCQGDRLGLLEEIFAWGMNFETSRLSKKGSDESQIIQMFNADSYVLRRWEDMKEEHIEATSSVHQKVYR